MTKRHLFLHAGTHKTGTTSIQQLLFDRRADIAALGPRVILDHPSGGLDTNCKCIANAFIRQELWTTQRIRDTEGISRYGSVEVLDHFARQIKSSAAQLILSAEGFCYARTRTERKHLVRFFANLDCDVTPIVFLRNDLDWRESWRAQNTGPRLDVFIQRHPERFTLFDDWYFDRDAIVAFWRSISPQATILDYDEEVARRGSVIPSFLETVRLPLSLDSGRYFLQRRIQPHGRVGRNLAGSPSNKPTA
jgi:hypothetical protein